MKKILLTLLILTISSPAFAGTKLIAHTEGMVCDFCVRGIEKMLGKKDEVESIEVSMDNQTVIVNLHDGKNLSDDEVLQIILDNGVSALRVERE